MVNAPSFDQKRQAIASIRAMTEYLDAHQIAELFEKNSHSFAGYLMAAYPDLPRPDKHGISLRSKKKNIVRLWDADKVRKFKALYENPETRDSMIRIGINKKPASNEERPPRFANDLATLFIRRSYL